MWYERAIKRPITTGEYSVRTKPIVAVVEHVTDGWDSINHGQNVSNKSSFHFLIGRYSGVVKVFQFMSIDVAAWGNGVVSRANPHTPAWLRKRIDAGENPNNFTVSIEHERDWPYSTAWDEEIIQESMLLNRWLAEVKPTIPRDRDHFIGHYQIDHINRPFCPGGPGGLLFPFDRIVHAVQEPTAPHTQVLGDHAIAGLFLQKYLAYGGLNKGIELFGFPRGPVRTERIGQWEGPVQWFERARMEDHNGTIMLGLLGNELLALPR
jgi:N-acetyl-anhydromuramyl-L-alanine amidase AmpD